MADQRSRGGKKVGTEQPEQSEKRHEGVRPAEERPAAGQPGGPKQHSGKTRSEHHKDADAKH